MDELPRLYADAAASDEPMRGMHAMALATLRHSMDRNDLLGRPHFRYGRVALPEDTVRWIAKQILLALAACQAAGIMHRDLHPQNVLVMRQAFSNDFERE